MADSEQTKQKGFTLVELLVTLAITLIVVASLSSTFIFQRKTYDVQLQINEMVQNARGAMDMMSGEMMMTGYGVTSTALSTWINWAGVTFGNDPVVIETGTGALGSDIIHVAGCFDGPATILATAAASGATTITVNDGSEFNTTTKSNICINGIERAVVTGVAGNSLTIDTDPGTAGNQGLFDSFAATVDVCVVKVISYSIVDDGGDYVLKRNENLGAGRQPLAENIIDMQIINTITNASGKIISWEINPLTARTDKPDSDYSQNNGYRKYRLRSVVTPPNLAFEQ
ncbi:MAG: prepilin-type N-terminal cleavage/methylation domain-containing protein [Deltaproteobacteria bacterium]|nr:prepilin-type N-terminal cleavage/methylation domain-containing protein [Deltaproteobacteria bacterium]